MAPTGPVTVAIAAFTEDASLDHSLGQLLDERRDAIGTIDELVGDLLKEHLATANVGHHLGGLPSQFDDRSFRTRNCR
jgi:hypothetical protein